MASGSNEDKQVLADRLLAALQHYSRSIELCKDYIRGLCGLKKVSFDTAPRISRRLLVTDHVKNKTTIRSQSWSIRRRDSYGGGSIGSTDDGEAPDHQPAVPVRQRAA